MSECVTEADYFHSRAVVAQGTQVVNPQHSDHPQTTMRPYTAAGSLTRTLSLLSKMSVFLLLTIGDPITFFKAQDSLGRVEGRAKIAIVTQRRRRRDQIIDYLDYVPGIGNGIT